MHFTNQHCVCVGIHKNIHTQTHTITLNYHNNIFTLFFTYTIFKWLKLFSKSIVTMKGIGKE